MSAASVATPSEGAELRTCERYGVVVQTLSTS